jgi:RNA polymerase sigma factor (sigma-70 family)
MTPAPITLAPADFTLLCEVIRSVARCSGLAPEAAEDFSQHVHLRLLERNYAPLAMFAGQSSLRTYLTVVVRRLLLDWRNREFGKWRPSACAQRLGDAAIDLERLISRDGLGVEEAIALMQGLPSFPQEAALREIAAQLPRRCRPRAVVATDLEELSGTPFDDPIEAEQTATLRLLRLRRLRQACQRLPVADRRLLYLRFERNMSMSAIGAFLGEPAKPLYRRLTRIVSSLRRTLALIEATDAERPDGNGSDATPGSSVVH